MDIQEMQRNEVTLIDDVESLIDRVRTAHREAQAQADKAKEFASKAILAVRLAQLEASLAEPF